MSDLLLFGVAPYVAMTLLLSVSLWRFFFTRYKFSSLSSQFLETKDLFWGSITWHYGIGILFFGHLIGFLFPRQVMAWNGMPWRLLILEVTGLICGLLTLIGVVLLIRRRIAHARIRVVTSWMDIVVLFLLLVQVLSGLGIAVTLRWGSAWYVATLVPYIRSVFTLAPRIDLIADMPWLVKTHLVGATVIVAILPFTRLVHFLVPPISYLWRPYQVVIWNWDRKGIRSILIGAVLALLGLASGAAAEEKSSWYDKISVGGEVRVRSETQINYAPFTGGVDDDSFVLLRVRPHLDVRPVEGLRIFIQPQFSRAFAQEESTIANTNDEPGGTVPNANNVFDLHQGFLEFSKIGGSIVTLTLGRQELAYGDERLIGAFNWNNVGRTFDAAKVRLGWESVWVDGFFTWNERVAGNEYFGGLYSGWKISDTMALDTYGLLLRDNDGDGSAVITGLTLATVGGRFVGTCLEERIDYGLEAAVQFGKTHPNTHLAYAGHGRFGYTFIDTAWKPRLGIEYNHASGNDPGTARVERFNNLFPTNHDKYGYIDFASLRNLHDIVASTSVKPLEGVQLKLDYHLFLLPEPADGMFRATGAQLRAGAAGASHLAGHEVDFLAKYKWNKWANFLAGYSLFKGGSFFSDTGANGTAHFLYAQAQANF